MPRRRRIPTAAFRQQPAPQPAAAPDDLLAMLGRQQQPAPPFQLPELPELPMLQMPQMPWGQQQPAFAPIQRAAAAQPPELTQEEERDIWGRTMGGVQWLGETLDKPGAAVRGLLAGQPEQLANLIPFSDTLGITDPAERVYGRDLLEKLGIAPPNQPGLFHSTADLVGDVAGFGTEVLTDPLFWLTGPLGSLTKAGKLAAKGTEKAATTSAKFGKAVEQLKSITQRTPQVLQTTPAAVAQQFREGLRGMIGVGVPGTNIRAGLEMPLAMRNLAAGAIEKTFYGKLSPIRPLRGLFSHTTGGVYGGAIQRERDLAYAAARVQENRLIDFASAARDRRGEVMRAFRDVAEHHGKQGDDVACQAFERSMLEMGGRMPDADGMLQSLRKKWDLTADAPIEQISAATADFGQKMHEYFDAMSSTVREAGEKYKALGGNLDLLNDKFVSYYPRRLSQQLLKTINKDREAKGLGQLADIEEFWKMRRRYLRDYPGGTVGENRIATDRAFMGADELGGKMTEADWSKAMRDRLADRGIVQTPKNFTELRRQYFMEVHYKPDLDEAAVKGLFPANKEAIAAEIRRFTLPGMTEAIKGGVSTIKKTKSELDTMIQGYSRLPREVVKTGLFDRTAVDDWMGYMQSMIEQESTVRQAHAFLRQPGTIGEKGVPLAQAWRAAGFREEGLATFVKENRAFAEKYDPEKIGEFIKDLRINDQAAKVLRVFGQLTKPDQLNEIGKFVDKINSTYKGWLVLSPAFHTRNLGGGFWNNLADGNLNPVELIRGYWAAARYAHGDKGAMQFIDAGVNDGLLKGHGILLDMGGSAPKNVVPTGGLKEILEPFWQKASYQESHWWNPLALRGGFSRTATGEARQSILAKVQDKTYGLVEFINRGGAYEALRRKGLSPSEALHHVNRANFVYGRLAPFEKAYMRRVFPFWNWLRRNANFQLQTLFERPGGWTAQMARLMSQSATGGEYVPDFLRESLNVPLGGPEEAKSFLRQGGVPIEDLNKLVFSGGLPAVGRTQEKILAQMHPLLRFLPEKIANKQFYSGRKLSELEGYSGNRLIDTLLHYSPFSRQIGEFQSMADERKTLAQKLANQLTGFKTGTYDVGRIKEYDLRKGMQEKLASDPLIRDYTRFYLPKDWRQKPGAEESLLNLKRLQKIQQAIEKSKKASEKRKQQKMLKGG